MQGTVKAVQKAKLLVSQALNTPSGAAQTQTPNLSSSASSQVHPQSTSSAAPIRGNFAAIPSSSAEWPTVAQANRIGSTREPPTSSKNAPNKTMSVSEHGNDKVQSDTREMRAHSAPDLFCELVRQETECGRRIPEISLPRHTLPALPAMLVRSAGLFQLRVAILQVLQVLQSQDVIAMP